MRGRGRQTGCHTGPRIADERRLHGTCAVLLHTSIVRMSVGLAQIAQFTNSTDLARMIFSSLQRPPHSFYLSEGMYLEILTEGQSVAKISEADVDAAMRADDEEMEGLARRIAVYCQPTLDAEGYGELKIWLVNWRRAHYPDGSRQ